MAGFPQVAPLTRHPMPGAPSISALKRQCTVASIDQFPPFWGHEIFQIFMDFLTKSIQAFPNGKLVALINQLVRERKREEREKTRLVVKWSASLP